MLWVYCLGLVLWPMVYTLQYLLGTVHIGIGYNGIMLDLHVLIGAECAGDILTRRSTTGVTVEAADDCAYVLDAE